MKTNFFELVAGLSISGSLQLNIHQNESGTQTVSVMLSAKDPKATTGKNLPPMLLKGSPQELDEAFFEQVHEPVKRTIKLFANLEAYQQELDKAQKAGKKDKDSKDKSVKGSASSNLFSPQPDEQTDDDFEEQPEQPDDTNLLAEKKRLYDEAMQRVGDLNTQMKYKEAIAQLPDAEEYPEKAGEIQTKREQLQKRQELYASLQQEV
ncbi:MAG: system protein [Mucilaginibacter sp.]|nr:system protein [Mucilaginibacter sp.]